jgi:hypothetical protein
MVEKFGKMGLNTPNDIQ